MIFLPRNASTGNPVRLGLKTGSTRVFDDLTARARKQSAQGISFSARARPTRSAENDTQPASRVCTNADRARTGTVVICGCGVHNPPSPRVVAQFSYAELCRTGLPTAGQKRRARGKRDQGAGGEAGVAQKIPTVQRGKGLRHLETSIPIRLSAGATPYSFFGSGSDLDALVLHKIDAPFGYLGTVKSLRRGSEW